MHLFRKHQWFVAGIENFTGVKSGNGAQALVSCRRPGCWYTKQLQFWGMSTEAVERALEKWRD